MAKWNAVGLRVNCPLAIALCFYVVFTLVLKDRNQLLWLLCEMKGLCINMDLIAVNLHMNKNIEAVWANTPDDESITGSIYIKPSESLLNNPNHIKKVHIYSVYAPMSWTNISLLMQHFCIINDKFPQPKTDWEVFEELKDPWKSLTSTQGLALTLHTYNDDDSRADIGDSDNNRNGSESEYNINNEINHSQKTSYVDDLINDTQRISSTGLESNSYGGIPYVPARELNSLAGLKKVNSLVFYPGQYSGDYPSVLQQYLWPELRYLEIIVKDVNLTQILALKRTAPKLNYLNIVIHIGNIPDFVWTFNWDSLPWRTGFVFPFYCKPRNFTERFRMIPENKAKPMIIPPVHFHYAFSVLIQINDPKVYHNALQIDRRPLNQYLDFSYNQLESLGFFQVTLISSMNLYLNFSHNSLQKVNFKDRFHSTTPISNQTSKNIFSPRMLDLSYNKLDDPRVDPDPSWYSVGGSDFLLLSHLKEIYLQHNNFTRLPQYSEYYRGILANNRKSIKDLKELRILDMSFNYITKINPEDLIADDFSPLLTVSFNDNLLTTLPGSIFKARYLVLADFSNNTISFRGIWPQKIQWIKRTKRQTSIYLSGNSISDLDLSGLNQASINDLHKVLDNFHLYLDGNPLNCGCKTHRMFQYLVSASRSERTNEIIDILPDFSFYKNQWTCTTPKIFAGIPLMQIPEYQYKTMCDDTLLNCPAKCYCYHSWTLGGKLGYVIVANCSHDVEYALSTLPVELPNLTTHLYMYQNNLQSMCSVHTYLRNLEVLDLSLNKIDNICPEILSNLENVKELNLTRNQLQQIPEELALMKKLTKLDLSNNLLEELPKSIQNMTKLKDIVISGNKFRCDCGTFWMTEWLVNLFSRVKDPYSIVCVSGQGQGKCLIDLNQDDVGCLSARQLPPSHVLKYALIGLSSAFVFTILLAIVIYRKRGYIKIWIFTRYGFHPWDKIDENIKDKEYHAFVSCHSTDWPWVCDILMPLLEDEHGFKLSVHERDFELGAQIRDNITKAVNSSRRAIVVLTPEYAKSFWCNVEFLEAKVKAFNDRVNYIIVVLLKPVEHKKLDMVLRLYLETNTYVNATDNWLWKKMVYAMPKVQIAKLKDQHNNECENNHQEQHGGNDIGLGAVGGFNNEGIEDEGVPLLNVTIESNILQGKLNDACRLDDVIEENYYGYSALLNDFEGPNDDVSLLNVAINNNRQELHDEDDDDDDDDDDDVTLLQDTKGLEGEDIPLLNM